MSITAVDVSLPFTNAKREKYAHKLNLTPSLTDLVYKDERGCTLRSYTNKLDDYKIEMIPQHFERRIQLFFLQAVCVYKTGLTFESGPALNQGESPNKITISEEKKLQRNAAHSSTVPCLLTKIEKKRYVFLKDTHAYGCWNATLNMPRFVNNADILIDGKANEEKLRTRAVAWLNEVSKELKTPSEALKQFFDGALEEVEASLPKAGLEEKKVLREYKTIAQRQKERFTQNEDVYINHLLGIAIGKDDIATDALREIRYTAIQNAQFFQSKIAQKIHDLRKNLYKKRKPYDFEKALKEFLIQSAEEQGVLFKKLFHFTPKTQEKLSGREFTTLSHLQENSQIIQKTAQECLQLIASFQKQSILSRAGTLQTIRKAKRLTPKALAQKLSEVSDHKWTAEKVSRLENNARSIDEPTAKVLSEALDVDLQIFSPLFFDSL